MRHIISMATAVFLLAATQTSVMANTVIFQADFQAAADTGNASLGNLNSGTLFGTWSGNENNTRLDSDGGDRGALLEQGGLNLNADFAAAGQLGGGVNVMFDASPRRINANQRIMLIKGVDSGNNVLFVLGLSGDSNAGQAAQGRLSVFDRDWTGNGSAGVNGGAIQTFLGNPNDYPHQQSNNYDLTDMRAVELQLNETSFDVLINGAFDSTHNYLTAATDIARLNFSTDFAAGTWFDNFLVTDLVAPIPEPTTAALGLIGLAGLVARRRRVA